uniref:Solute carrier family 38 member 3 n=1 Tax=Accipiter nisus TaxID=211598 RepID=A0A8B9NLB2_9AVES
MDTTDVPLQAEMVELVPNGKHATTLTASAVPSLAGDRFEENQSGTAEMEEFLPHGAEKKQTHFTDFEGKTSFGMSVFNLSNAIMGSGILGLAYAMANTGIILFLFLLTAVALLSSYSIHLLLKSSGIVGIRAYEQLGYRAFGTPGKLAAAIAITLQNIGAMSSYLYIVKSEVPLVIQTFLNLEEKTTDWYMNGNYLVILVSVTVILPLALMKQLGYLGYASGFSLSCMGFFLISVIYKKFQIPCPLPEQEGNFTGSLNVTPVSTSDYQNGYTVLQAPDEGTCTPSFFTLNSQTAYTIPIMAFAFVCHPEVLPIYTELKNPSKKKMQCISNISIMVMYLMYFLAALFGYLTFYGESLGRGLGALPTCRHRGVAVLGLTQRFPAGACRPGGVGAAAHVQQSGPLRRAHPVRAGGRADGCHPHRSHRPLPGAPGHPADAVPRKGLQLDPPRHHRRGPADLHQPLGHLRPLHPWHLRLDRCHLRSLPHLHLPCHLLHPHHAQGQGAAALHPQNLGCLLRPPRGALHGHELELHHHRLGHGGGEERRQPLASTRCPRQPSPHPPVPQGEPAPGLSPCATALPGFPGDLPPSLPITRGGGEGA